MSQFIPFPTAHARTKKIIMGALSLFGSTGITLAVGLILAGLLARHFSPEEFGLWSILVSLNGILLTGFDLGFGNALRNKLAQLYKRSQPEDLQSPIYFFSIFYWFIFSALIFTGVFFALKGTIPWENLFRSTDVHILQDGSSLMITGASILAFNIAFNLYMSGFFAFQESHWNALLNGLSKLALLVCVFFFLVLGMSFYFLNLMFFLITLLGSMVSFSIFLSIRKWRWQSIPFSRAFEKVKELWEKSAQFALLQVFSVFLLNADFFVVSKVLGLEMVGDYFIVKRIYLIIASFHFAILLPIWSAYTESVESMDFQWVEKILRKTVFYTIIIFVGGILGMVLVGDSLIYLWTGKQINSVPLFMWLGVWCLIYGWNNCFSVFLNGTGNLKWQVVFVGLGSAAFIPLSLFWGDKYGIIGVCFALIIVSIPVGISNPIQSAAILKKYAKVGSLR
jgi:O-antigen/teichoic acid export membrane protein